MAVLVRKTPLFRTKTVEIPTYTGVSGPQNVRKSHKIGEEIGYKWTTFRSEIGEEIGYKWTIFRTLLGVSVA